MKFILLFSGFTLFASNAFAHDCSLQAESYLKNPGAYSQPGQFLSVDTDGNHQYIVRSNLQGGDSAHIVVVTPTCDYVSQKLLWSE